MKVRELPTFFCTGARNHDLLKSFDSFRLKFDIDERSASFKALGTAKLTEKPVSICTTSGTAVAECVPAMVEAYYGHTPLVLISADRPLRLRGSGAPQTIDHEVLTRGHRRTYLELSLDEFNALETDQLSYPAHINILIENSDEANAKGIVHTASLEDFEAFLSQSVAPFFLISHESHSLRPFVERLRPTGHAFYAESLSGARELSSIRYEQDLIEGFRNKRFDSVIRIGHTPLSKLWRLLEGSSLPVFSFDERGLPALSRGKVCAISGQGLLESGPFWRALAQSPKLAWKPDRDIEFLLREYPNSEMALVKRLHDELQAESIIYLGNSLVIRFFELIQTKPLRVFANRGANGIDGQLSTAIGIAGATTETVTCVLGDLTTEYDLSALRFLPPNLRLYVINNRGGRIFQTLNLSTKIILEHQRDLSTIIQALGLGHQVTEIFPDNEATMSFLQRWRA